MLASSNASKMLGVFVGIMFILLQLSFAAPTSPSRPAAITVAQVPNPRATNRPVQHRGLAAYAKALKKYAPAGVTPARAARLEELAKKYGSKPTVARDNRENIDQLLANETSGAIIASPVSFDEQYISPLTIGNQSFLFDFDTGSSDLWVLGPKAGHLSNQTTYSPGPQAKRLSGETFDQSYGDGSSVSGIVYTDTVTIGGLPVQNQAVEVATKTPFGGFDNEDGIVGLAFDSINQVKPNQQTTIFTNLLPALSQPIFSADLRHGEAGCYYFGTVPEWALTSSVFYIQADPSQGYWTFSPTGFSVGNGKMNSSSSTLSSLVGVADTGTTLILEDYPIVEEYYAQVPSARMGIEDDDYWVFDCNATLPDLTIQVGATGGVGGFDVVVPGQYLNYQPLTHGTCFGGIQPTFGVVPFSIYGDMFLKNVLVIFDRTDNSTSPRLGFASK